MEKLKVVITIAERVRSKGRDRGLERWGLWNSSERGEENFFFIFIFFYKLVEKRNWFIRICLVLVRNCNWKWNWKKEIV